MFDHVNPWKIFFDFVSGNGNTRVTLQDATQKSFFVECDDQFELLLDELGIREVIGEDDEALRTMWNNLKVREEYRLRTILLANIKVLECIIKAFQVIIVYYSAGSKPWYDGKLWSCFISTHRRSREKTDRTKADGNSISVQESSSRRTFETSIWRYGDTNAKGTWHLWRHISYASVVKCTK